MATYHSYSLNTEELSERFNAAKGSGKKFLFVLRKTISGGNICDNEFTYAADSKAEAFSHLCELTQKSGPFTSYDYIGRCDISTGNPKIIRDELKEHEKKTLEAIYDQKFPPTKNIKQRLLDLIK